MTMDGALAALKIKFIERCRDDVAILDLATRQLSPDVVIDEREDLLKRVHSLAGSGGIFGYIAISELAYEVESQILANEGRAGTMLKASLTALVREMQLAIS